MEIIYKSPKIYLEEMAKLIKLHGQNRVQTGSKFRDQRELYIGSIFSLGQASHSGIYCWLRKPEEDPPDIECCYLSTKIEGGNIRNIIQIEIVEFSNLGNKNLFQTIKDKILSNNYPDDYILLCYIHHCETYILPKELQIEISQLKPKLSAIYLMMDLDNQRNAVLTQLHPTLERIDFNIINIMNSWPKDMLEINNMTRGKTNDNN